MSIFFSLVLIFLLQSNGECVKTNDPCLRLHCPENNLCWIQNNKATCENGCAYTDCKRGYSCVTQTGPCGNAYCKPVGKCYRNPPSDPCKGFQCAEGQVCTTVEDKNGDVSPVCIQNPCSQKQCCKKSDGCICQKDGCYLKQSENSPPGKPKTLIPECQDPCRVQNKMCPVGTFCYTNNAVCISQPCNPITECRKPCGTDLVNICGDNQKCNVIYVNCISDKNNPNYDPFCKPIEYCAPKTKNPPPPVSCDNPCKNKICTTDSLCWNNNGIATCVNACKKVTCNGCVTVVGSCGNSNCKPVPKCEEAPSKTCDGIKCPEGQNCIVVQTIDKSSVPICGKNPCIEHKCCSVRDSDTICDNDGCYLEKDKDSCKKSGQACKVTPECRDPCCVENIKCPALPNVYCYKTQVECLVAPCNPVPECRVGCDSAKNVCNNNQKCILLNGGFPSSCDPNKSREYCSPWYN